MVLSTLKSFTCPCSNATRLLVFELDLLLSEVVRRRILHVLQRHSVDSVTFVLWRMSLTKEDVAKVTAALVSVDLIRVRLDVLRTDVALIAGPIALIPRRPTVVGEFRAHAVQWEVAATASEVPGLGILLNELVRPRRFCAILTEASVRHRC